MTESKVEAIERRRTVRRVLEGKREAILSGLRFASEYGTGSYPAEVVDAAVDALSEETVYLTPEGMFEIEVEMTREVYALLGLDPGASDATHVSDEDLAAAISRLEPKSCPTCRSEAPHRNYGKTGYCPDAWHTGEDRGLDRLDSTTRIGRTIVDATRNSRGAWDR